MVGKVFIAHISDIVFTIGIPLPDTTSLGMA